MAAMVADWGASETVALGSLTVAVWAGWSAHRSAQEAKRANAQAMYLPGVRFDRRASNWKTRWCCSAFPRLLVAPPHREGGQAQFIRKPLAERTGDSKINTLLDFLRENLAQTHRLDDLAERLNLSRRTFSRHFKQATGLTLGDWLLQERLRQAQDLLQDSDDSIERIAEKSGFGTASNLREQFKAQFHTSPNAWRKTFRSGE